MSAGLRDSGGGVAPERARVARSKRAARGVYKGRDGATGQHSCGANIPVHGGRLAGFRKAESHRGGVRRAKPSRSRDAGALGKVSRAAAQVLSLPKRLAGLDRGGRQRKRRKQSPLRLLPETEP